MSLKTRGQKARRRKPTELEAHATAIRRHSQALANLLKEIGNTDHASRVRNLLFYSLEHHKNALTDELLREAKIKDKPDRIVYKYLRETLHELGLAPENHEAFLREQAQRFISALPLKESLKKKTRILLAQNRKRINNQAYYNTNALASLLHKSIVKYKEDESNLRQHLTLFIDAARLVHYEAEKIPARVSRISRSRSGMQPAE